MREDHQRAAAELYTTRVLIGYDIAENRHGAFPPHLRQRVECLHPIVIFVPTLRPNITGTHDDISVDDTSPVVELRGTLGHGDGGIGIAKSCKPTLDLRVKSHVVAGKVLAVLVAIRVEEIQRLTIRRLGVAEIQRVRFVVVRLRDVTRLRVVFAQLPEVVGR